MNNQVSSTNCNKCVAISIYEDPQEMWEDDIMIGYDYVEAMWFHYITRPLTWYLETHKPELMKLEDELPF